MAHTLSAKKRVRQTEARTARNRARTSQIKTFIKKGLAAGDKIHLKKEGSELMADRFLCAMEKDFRAWLKDHPDAGCSAR